jgi:DNA-binding CsgD family transcriptional regulator
MAAGVAALTPAERRVVEFAAAGRTNRQIAEVLHLSTSTVEFHLTRAFRKLGASSRGELPRLIGEPAPR